MRRPTHLAQFELFSSGARRGMPDTAYSSPQKENSNCTQMRGSLTRPSGTRRLPQSGFTIIELMIATAVFATVLLICTFAMLQIGRTYYKGITASRTQETARAIIDEVSEAIRFGSGNPQTLTAGGNLGYCIGGKLYSYALDRQVVDTPNVSQNQSRHALVVDEVACAGASAQTVAPSPPANPSGRELINTRMRLMRFDVQQIGSSDLYRVVVRVVSGDNDLLTNDPGNLHMNCSSQRAGGQFCAVSELSTVVQKRVN